MNGTLPIFNTNPIKAGDDLEEGSTVYRAVMTSIDQSCFKVDGFRFGLYIQDGIVQAYKNSEGTQFIQFGGVLSDPTSSPHFRTLDDAQAYAIEQIQVARENLQDQIGEILQEAKSRHDSVKNCCHKKTSCEKEGACST